MICLLSVYSSCLMYSVFLVQQFWEHQLLKDKRIIARCNVPKADYYRLLQDSPSHLLTVWWLIKSSTLLPPLPKYLRKAWPRAVLQHQMALLPEENRRRPELQAREKLAGSSKQERGQHYAYTSASTAHRGCPSAPAVKPHPKYRSEPAIPRKKTAVRSPAAPQSPEPSVSGATWFQQDSRNGCRHPGEHLTTQVKAMAVLLFWQHPIRSKGNAFDC